MSDVYYVARMLMSQSDIETIEKIKKPYLLVSSQGEVFLLQ